MLLQDGNGLECILLGSFDIFLVIRLEIDERAGPTTDLGHDLRICKRHPFENRSIAKGTQLERKLWPDNAW